jgi:hypothetical protein
MSANISDDYARRVAGIVWKFYLKFLRPGDLIIFGISGSLFSERTHHLRAQDLR